MIKVNKLITETLKTLGVPICRGHYRGTERDWIRYELIDIGAEIFHDGKSSGRVYAYNAWINTEGSPDYLAERAAEALEAAGFYGFRFEDASYEENTGLNRIMIEFAYMEI